MSVAQPDPAFTVLGAEPIPRCATPTLRFRLGVEDATGTPVHFIALTALITVEPGRRTYTPSDRERLVELFGEPERWGSTTGSFRWSQLDTVIGPFESSGLFELDVECGYDHEITVTKYCSGLGDGTIPLRLHFNGTIYFDGGDGGLQILPLAWDRSARFELPLAVWREMIDEHYPGGAWLRVSQGILGELSRFKTAAGAPTLDDAMRQLLDAARPEVRP
jgi:hypothetical protein